MQETRREEWINIKDHQPQNKERVLIQDDIYNVVDIGCWNEEHNAFQENNDWGDFVDYHIEWWMPLPELIKEQK